MSQVADTSLDIYFTKVLPHLAASQAIVFHILSDASHNNFDMTDKELSRALHWEINCITGRRDELVKLGLVVLNQKRSCGVTGNRAKSWKVKE
jgi:L-alanine-DL-glutamate epimerase-like enolase superfamily enzyme